MPKDNNNGASAAVAGSAQPRTLDAVNVTIEDGPRVVTFTSRPRLAIHPVVIAVPWSVLKATAAAIMDYEAKMEIAALGSSLNTQVVNAGDGTGGTGKPM